MYVDEYTCIGCTNCAYVAPNTFYMDDEHGRARVFQQWKDRPTVIQTAIETCPVDCIHYVPFEELERLEQERDQMVINYKARLVGSDGLLSSGGAERGARAGYVDWTSSQTETDTTVSWLLTRHRPPDATPSPTHHPIQACRRSRGTTNSAAPTAPRAGAPTAHSSAWGRTQSTSKCVCVCGLLGGGGCGWGG